jgi:hypothetical protein
MAATLTIRLVGIDKLDVHSCTDAIGKGAHLYWIKVTKSQGVVMMSTPQAFLLGIMVAWTPSLIMLAWIVWHSGGVQGQSRRREGP